MGYEITEIPSPRANWTSWLRQMAVGETKIADLKDRSKIATSISNNFHKRTPHRFKIRKLDGLLIEIERLEDEVYG